MSENIHKPKVRDRSKKRKYKSKINRNERKRKKCGAKLRGKNRICENWAMKNGRCRLHGGKSKGAKRGKENPLYGRVTSGAVKKGEKRALVTGEHETIWFDNLHDDEVLWLQTVKLDVESQLNEEIKLLTIRERRMLKRIEELNQKNFTVTEIVEDHEEGITPKGYVDSNRKSKKKTNTLDQIQRIEEALTRIQDKKNRFLELKFKMQSSTGDDTGALEQLVDVIAASRKAISKQKFIREKPYNKKDKSDDDSNTE